MVSRIERDMVFVRVVQHQGGRKWPACTNAQSGQSYDLEQISGEHIHVYPRVYHPLLQYVVVSCTVLEGDPSSGSPINTSAEKKGRTRTHDTPKGAQIRPPFRHTLASLFHVFFQSSSSDLGRPRAHVYRALAHPCK